MSELVAGVDCSTQATKVAVVDVDTGAILALARADHTVSGTGGARETDPHVWWGALREALAATGMGERLRAVSIGGQQHGLVALDRDHQPLRPAILWNDTRSAPDAASLGAALGGPGWWATRIGVVPVASFTASKWAWLRRVEPEVAAHTAAIRLPHDYLTERLTGEDVTDRGDASGTAWWSAETEAYAPEVLALDALQLDAALLPRVLGPREAAGEVRPMVARELGLPRGALVAPGTGDNMAAALGLGLEPGTPVLSLGTSGTVFAASTLRAADPTGIVAGFADATGRFLPLACTLNCTLAVDRMAGWLGLDRDDVAPSNGVVVLPYFDGERTPNLPDASAATFGLRHDTDPRSLLMATYEGAVIGLIEALESVAARSSGLDPDAPLLLVGGGARGETWRRVVQRLVGRPVLVPDLTELVAVGAAAQAAALLGNEDPVRVAKRWRTRAGLSLDRLPPDEDLLTTHARTRQQALGAVSAQRVSRPA